jgi:hypothetical protein
LSKPTKFQADSIFTIEKNELGEKITFYSPNIEGFTGVGHKTPKKVYQTRDDENVDFLIKI